MSLGRGWAGVLRVLDSQAAREAGSGTERPDEALARLPDGADN